MGRVEWVTCQVPESQSMEGGVKSEEDGADVVVGARSLIAVDIF